MLRDKPDVRLIRTEYVTDKHIVRSVVPCIVGRRSTFVGLAQNDLVCFKYLTGKDRDRTFCPARRPGLL